MRHNAFICRADSEYFVRYSDGSESMLMPLAIARDYAEMFGGRVVKATPIYERFFFGLFRRVSHYI